LCRKAHSSSTFFISLLHIYNICYHAYLSWAWRTTFCIRSFCHHYFLNRTKVSYIIIIWDPVTGQEILTISEDVRWANFIAFTPDGKYIISNVYSKQKTVPFINIYDANTGKKKTIISTKPEQYSPIAISPDGNLIAFVPNNKKTIGLFDITADKEINTVSDFSGHTDKIKSLAFSPDGKMLVSGSADKSVKLWDVATGKEIRTMGE